MSYMILRRERPDGAFNDGETGMLDVAFAPASEAVRLSISGGKVTLSKGPFDGTWRGFSMIEAADVAQAAQWLRRWPVGDEAVELEIRQSGCPDNCVPILAQALQDAGKRFAILLRSSPDLEYEVPVAPEKITALDAHNAAEASAGRLLAGDGLRSTAKGARVRASRNAFTVMDGPFTEIKELIAGFWLIRAASLDEAIAWAIRNPYPTGPDVEVEIREVLADPAAFTAELESAESRIRAEQLEAGMRAYFTA